MPKIKCSKKNGATIICRTKKKVHKTSGAPKKHEKFPRIEESSRRRKAIRAKLIARDGDKCHWCGEKMDFATIEHLIPQSKGGGWQLWNLVLAHEKCNQAHGTKVCIHDK